MAVMYAFYPMVIIAGFVQLLAPSTIHMIMKHFNLKAGTVGIIPLIYFTGMMISAVVITHLIKKLSVKQLMSSGAIIVSVSLLAASQSHSYFIFALLFFLTGFGNGIMIILPGIYATNQYSEKSAQLQSIIFSFIALGFVVGPVFPGIVSYLQLSWRWCFAFPGLLILPGIIPIILAKHEPIDHTEKLTFRIVKEIISFDRKFFFLIVIAVIIAAGSSTGLLTWLVTFLEIKRGTPLGMAHVVLATLGVASVAGRLIWGRVSSKITVYHTLLFIVPISAALVFFAPLPETTIVNIILFFIATIFLSGINPLFLSAASVYPKSLSSSAYTVLFISISIGGMLIPFGIGQVFQYAGAEVAISSISILLVIVIGALLLVKKEIPVIKHLHQNPLP